MSEHLLEPLDPRQREVAQAARGTVVVVAVAGAGKTRAIAHRIAYAISSGAQPAQTGLAITYTTKAAAELNRRLTALGVEGVTCGTLHSIALRQLAYFWPQALGGRAWSVIGDRERELKTLLSTLALGISIIEERQVISEIGWAKARGLTISDYQELQPSRLPAHLLAPLAALWASYETQNDRSQRIDFDDVLQLLLGLLDSRPDFAEQVRRRYTWFTIDEFQDATPLQMALIKKWLGDSEELCVVGDPSQSIYEFAGAEPRLLKELAVAGESKLVIELDRTYRCAPEIVELAASLVSEGGLKPVSVSASGSAEISTYPTSDLEAKAIASEIAGLVASGVDPRQIAVLVRISAQLAKFQRELARFEVPVVVKEAGAVEQSIARRLLLALADEFAEERSLTEVVGDALKGLTSAADQVEVSGFLALAADLQTLNAHSSVENFREELARRLASQDLPPARAVTLQTMHSAKGLEWDHVYLPELVDTLLPFPSADVEVERNLLYVAITRARRAVRLSYAAMDERGRSTNKSPLLTATAIPALRKAAPTSVPTREEIQTRKALCLDCGRGLTSAIELRVNRCSQCHRERPLLVESLIHWRAQKAAELSIPPRLFLTDSSLAALASELPETPEALAKTLGPASQRAFLFANELLNLLHAL